MCLIVCTYKSGTLTHLTFLGSSHIHEIKYTVLSLNIRTHTHIKQRHTYTGKWKP